MVARPNQQQTQAPARSSGLMTPAEFVTYLAHENQKLSKFMPDLFWQQGSQNLEFFVVTSQMLEDGLIRIKLLEPRIISETSLDVIFTFQAIMSENYDFIPMERNQSGDVPWLPGFRSVRLELTNQEVVDGLLSQSEMNDLRKHAEFFERVGAEAYNRNPEYTKIRPYLTNKPGKRGAFKFLCDVRLNPRTNEEVIGIHIDSWTPGAFQLIGKISETESIGTMRQSLGRSSKSNADDFTYDSAAYQRR